MDAREQLRRYLEQRRELGERDLVLDGLAVEEVLRMMGAAGGASRTGLESADTAKPLGDGPPGVADGDWRQVLAATKDAAPRRAPAPDAEVKVVSEAPQAGPEASAPPTAPPKAEPPRATVERSTSSAGGDFSGGPAPSLDDTPVGLVVGSGERAMFGGALDTVTTLDAIAEMVRACSACGLAKLARNAVPGEGNPNADFVLVGEAPGQNEDESGRPFVGPAGQLLTKILAAINLAREDVYICNVIKHRPPNNRNPLPEEVNACSPFLRRQIELLRPKVIVALGTFAAQTLLETKTPIGKLRGQLHQYYGVPLVATYHPAALLRNPAWKRPTWEDVQLARRILDRASGA